MAWCGNPIPVVAMTAKNVKTGDIERDAEDTVGSKGKSDFIQI